jgi:hypothetical protein
MSKFERMTEWGSKVWRDPDLIDEEIEVSPTIGFYDPPYERGRTKFNWRGLPEKEGYIVARDLEPVAHHQGRPIGGDNEYLIEDKYKSLIGVHKSKLEHLGYLVQSTISTVKEMFSPSDEAWQQEWEKKIPSNDKELGEFLVLALEVALTLPHNKKHLDELHKEDYAVSKPRTRKE